MDSHSETHYYFAYGSNLSPTQMAEQCPSSVYRGRAVLSGYRWQINERGVANVVQSEEHQVEGVVFTITHQDEQTLDRSEGVVFTITHQDEQTLDRSEGVNKGWYEKKMLPMQLFEWKHPMDTALVARKLRQNEPLNMNCNEKSIQALVYLSSTYVQDGLIREEYIGRMQRAMQDAVSLGISVDYSSRQVSNQHENATNLGAQDGENTRDHVRPDDDVMAMDLSSCTITPRDAIQINQIYHRLNLLSTWFGSRQEAKATLSGKTILELGCGQGDMTAALAYMVSSQDPADDDRKGKVIGVDPAPLDYGTPFNLGEAQAALSRSKLGTHIQWVQADPIAYLKSAEQHQIDFVVFAHSLFYLPSAEYLSNVLTALRGAASPDTKLLLADWGMQFSAPEAEAHILAVKVQLESPSLDANIRTVIDPQTLKSMISHAGWRLLHEEWIRRPNMDDGSWEVGNVRKKLTEKNMTDKGKEYFDEMEKLVETHGGVVKSMDIWTSVCTT